MKETVAGKVQLSFATGAILCTPYVHSNKFVNRRVLTV
jgi:hypothetical protein